MGMAEQKIPKILHYCAFGSGFQISEEILATWKKYCPDYEIMCWSESNFDINCCDYVREAYESRKWAFVSDVARLWALKNHGGIYLDTDVELTGNLDKFLAHDTFVGYEDKDRVGTAIIGAAAGSSMISDLLDEYSNLRFITDGGEDLTPNVEKIGRYLTRNGFTLDGKYNMINGVAVYPQEYFSPRDFVTGKINKTSNTCAIHHYQASWKTPEEIDRDGLFFKFNRRLPQGLAWNIASYISVMKHRGIIRGHKDMFKLLAGKKDD